MDSILVRSTSFVVYVSGTHISSGLESERLTKHESVDHDEVRTPVKRFVSGLFFKVSEEIKTILQW